MNFPNVGRREGHLLAVLPSRKSLLANYAIDFLLDLPLRSVQLVSTVKDAPSNDGAGRLNPST